MTELLQCENLVLGYPAKANASGIVAPFSFELGEGEVVALLGENGCEFRSFAG